MAMPFGNEEVDEAFFKIFKPAVEATDFSLIRVDKDPPAGLIDNRLRTEVRTSRFVIADLTHTNPGAYWEAGFAEGLDKPVIYTCEESFWEGSGTHFDTEHSHTIIWSLSSVKSSIEKLMSTIRATFPKDASMED